MRKPKANIAVLVSGGGTNLQALIDYEKNGCLQSGTIQLVIASNPNAFAIHRAINAGIACVCIGKREFGESVEEKIIETLQNNEIDMIVLAGYMSILSEKFTKLYERRILNVHPSLIPSFCGEGFYGLRVHEAAIKKGVKVTGATVHFVNEVPDDGEIIMQKAVDVYEDDTPQILQKRVMELAEWEILPKAVEAVCKEWIDLKQKEQ